MPYCAIVHGEAEVGESCASLATHGFPASSCASASFCDAEGICSEVPPQIELELGLELGLGEPCVEAQYACVDGTHCDTHTGVYTTRIGRTRHVRAAGRTRRGTFAVAAACGPWL